MTDIIIYGVPLSPHVRTARMTAIEKGVPHTVEMADFEDMKTPEHFAVHPFGRIPAMRHGDHVIWETQAICHYIDEAFDGPALVPSDPLGRAHVEQWLSAANDYFAKIMLSNFAAKYVISNVMDTELDQQAIDDALPVIEEYMEKIDRALENKTFLVGDSLTLADLRLMSFIDGIRPLPKMESVLGKAPNVKRSLEALNKRKSFKDTYIEWPFERGAAA